MITNKLKKLSINFKELGKMDTSYKGFASFSSVSNELQKAILSIYMNEISLIIIDYENYKILWINKDLYLENNKVLIYVENNNHLIFVRNDTINNYIILSSMNYYNKNKSDMLINFLEIFNIFNNKIIITDITNIPNIKDGFFYTLKSYLSNNNQTTISQSEKLRYIIGENIYNYLITNNITPSDMAIEFNNKIINYKKKLIYMLC